MEHLKPRTAKEWIELLPYVNARNILLSYLETDRVKKTEPWFATDKFKSLYAVIICMKWSIIDSIDIARLAMCLRSMEKSVKLKPAA